MASRKWVRLSVSAAESNQRERNRGRTVSGKNVEEMEKGYAIQTKRKHEIIKPFLQPRIELSLRDNALERPRHQSWSKEELFIPIVSLGPQLVGNNLS